MDSFLPGADIADHYCATLRSSMGRVWRRVVINLVGQRSFE